METKDTRPSLNDYLMNIAIAASERATCLSRRVGAIIVKDKHILATGYNGAPSGVEHCLTRGCLRIEQKIPSGERHEMCRGAHAEQNAIYQAAKTGTAIDGSSMYCTTFPCSFCAKAIINSGIKELFYLEGYTDSVSEELLNEAGIKINKLKPPQN